MILNPSTMSPTLRISLLTIASGSFSDQTMPDTFSRSDMSGWAFGMGAGTGAEGGARTGAEGGARTGAGVDAGIGCDVTGGMAGGASIGAAGVGSGGGARVMFTTVIGLGPLEVGGSSFAWS